MQKSDMDFYIYTYIPKSTFILIKDIYTPYGTITLDQGNYTIWAGGARGGSQGEGGSGGSKGKGGAFGQQGATAQLDIEVFTTTVLTYRLGELGTDGGRGAHKTSLFSDAGDGGYGGGGGSTVLEFSSEIRLKKKRENSSGTTNHSTKYRVIGLDGGDGAHSAIKGGTWNTGRGNNGMGGKEGWNVNLGIIQLGKATAGSPGLGGKGFKFKLSNQCLRIKGPTSHSIPKEPRADSYTTGSPSITYYRTTYNGRSYTYRNRFERDAKYDELVKLWKTTITAHLTIPLVLKNRDHEVYFKDADFIYADGFIAIKKTS